LFKFRSEHFEHAFNTQQTCLAMKSITSKFIAICSAYTWATASYSHDGHGLDGAHWHATDVAGFVALGVAIVAAIWLSRGGK
jgi:hypothetical protein